MKKSVISILMSLVLLLGCVGTVAPGTESKASDVTSFDVSFTGVSFTSATGFFIADLAEKLPDAYVKNPSIPDTDKTTEHKVMYWDMPVTLVSATGRKQMNCEVFSFYKNGDTTNSGNLWFAAQNMETKPAEGDYLIIDTGDYRDRTGLYELKVTESAMFYAYPGGGKRWAFAKTFDVTLGKVDYTNGTGSKFVVNLGQTSLPKEYTDDTTTTDTEDNKTMFWDIPLTYKTPESTMEQTGKCRVYSLYNQGHDGDLYFWPETHGTPYGVGTEYRISAGTYWGAWAVNNGSEHASEKFALVLDRDYIYQRSSTGWVLTDKYDIAKYRSDKDASGAYLTYPTKEGYVFSGWYEDAELTTPLQDASVTEGFYYAKFVDERVLSVKFQVGDVADSTAKNLRLVTTVDSLAYESVGFEVAKSGGRLTRTSNKVYRTVKGGGETYVPSVFCETSQFFMTIQFIEIPDTDFTTSLTVTPFWKTLDGTKVTGISRVHTIQDIIDDYNAKSN